MNPWFAKAVILATTIIMVAIRAAHGKRSRAVEVIKSTKGPVEVFLLAVAWISFLVPILWVATSWPAFADLALRPLPLILGSVILALALALWLFYRSHADLGTNGSVTLEIRKAHQLVRGQFKGEYGAYMARTKRLIPGLW